MQGDLLTESMVFAAYRVLFADEVEFNSRVLQSLELPEIKKAYRRRALDTHPDRFESCGAQYQKVTTDRFIEVSDAYEKLSTYLTLRDKGFEFTRDDDALPEQAGKGYPFHWHQPRSTSRFTYRDNDAFASSFWKLQLPRRHLRLGEFLYYSGVISWRHLIRALVWQRRQRPRIGEIAQRWRWLNEYQLLWVLKDKRPGELLGQALLRRRLISPFQLSVLLCQQRRIQEPIGLYFVQQGMLTEREILQYLQRQNTHNLGV